MKCQRHGHCFGFARWDENEMWPFISLDTKY